MAEWHNYSSGEDIGRPYQGRVWWKVETSYKSSIGNINDVNTSGFPQQVSPVIEVARLETGEVNKYYRSIDSPNISKATKSNIDRTFHLEYLVPTDELLMEYLGNRSSGTVRSLTFVCGANTSRATASWYKMTGCKCKSWTVSSSNGEAWKVSADFSVATSEVSGSSFADSVMSTPSAGGERTGDICHFNVGSRIDDGGGNTFAYSSQALSLTINHNLEDGWSVGNRDKQWCVEKGIDITGTCDISLDDGGGYHYRDVIDANTETNVEILLSGLSNVPRIHLTNVRWNSDSIDIGSTEPMVDSAPFTAETAVISTTSN